MIEVGRGDVALLAGFLSNDRLENIVHGSVDESSVGASSKASTAHAPVVLLYS